MIIQQIWNELSDEQRILNQELFTNPVFKILIAKHLEYLGKQIVLMNPNLVEEPAEVFRAKFLGLKSQLIAWQEFAVFINKLIEIQTAKEQSNDDAN